MHAAVRILAVAAITSSLLAADVHSANLPPAAADYEAIGLCTDGGPRPCVASVLRNGAPLDGDWGFVAMEYVSRYGDPGHVRFIALGADGDDLGFTSLDDTWEVTLDTGTFVPRVAAGKGRDVTVERLRASDTSTTHLVRVSAHPVTLSGQCDSANYCPEWADYPDPIENNQWDSTLDIEIYDGSWMDPDDVDTIDGLTYFSNVATTSIPPQVRRDDKTGTDYLWIELANRHYLEDGTTVVQGHAELRIPNAFLRTAYGVPNPELMTGESIAPSVSGSTAGAGTISVTQEPGADAMLVNIEGLTFSRRVARILRGVIVPTRPGGVEAKRVATHVAKLTFQSSHSRGARVRGYTATCHALHAEHVVSTHTASSPVTVRGLRRSTPYTCTVQARSRAGVSSGSRPSRVSPRP